MLKRTKGRLLISLLVITGLAGTLNSSTLSQKERKQAVQQMKQTRNEVINSVTGLSTEQLNFRSSKKTRSIREVVYTLATLESALAKEIKEVMDMPSESEKRLLIQHDDEAIRNLNSSSAVNTPFQHYTDINEAIHEFTISRNEHIKYLRTSTEDLRNHVSKTTIGWVDAYQRFLLHLNTTQQLLAEINQIRSSPGFDSLK